MRTTLFLLFFIFIAHIAKANECLSYQEFDHKTAVILTAKYLGDKYDYVNNSRAYLAMTDAKLLKQVFGDKEKEAAALKQAEIDFKEQVKNSDSHCFEVVSSLDIGNYDLTSQTFSITEISEQYSMIFEPTYTRNNRFPQKFQVFIANYNDIKPIPYVKEQVESLLNELFTQQARILHKFYFDVVGLKTDHRNSLLVKVTNVEVILEKQKRVVINSYQL